MRDRVAVILDNTTLVAVAAGLALAWTFVRLAEAIGAAVVVFLSSGPAESTPPLSVELGNRVLYLADVLRNLIAFLLTVAAVLLALTGPRRVR